MNWVDLLILGMVGLGLRSGYRRGAVQQVFSWGGFIVGLIAGAFTATEVTRMVDPSVNTQTALVLILLFGTAFLVEALIAYAGARIAGKVTHVGAKRVDKVIGSAVAGSLALLSAWLISAPAKQSPQVAPAISKSAILRGMYSMLSTPPNIVATVGQFLNATGFPEVFAGLNPSLSPGIDPAPDSLKRNTGVIAAAKLTYKIQSEGCKGLVNGSGFSVSDDTVITAAHVVAGTRGSQVIEPPDGGGRRYKATVVYIDTAKDIAVLRVRDLPAERLDLVETRAQRGTDGAAIGYPGGLNRRISVARVRIRAKAKGRDIYSSDEVNREIYVLRAEVRQGNSGGPFVDAEGGLRGMIFAASAQDDEESYALAETEIQRALSKAQGKTRQVDTKDCAI